MRLLFPTALVVALGATVIVLCRGTRPSPASPSGVEEEESGDLRGSLVSLLPDGEWWASTGEFVALAHFDGQQGLLAVRRPGVPDEVHDIHLAIPDFREPETVEYTISGNGELSVWGGRLSVSESAPGKGEMVTIMRVDGALGKGSIPFEFRRARDAEGNGNARDELRGLMERERRRRRTDVMAEEARARSDAAGIDLVWWNVRAFSSARRGVADIAMIARVLAGAEIAAFGGVDDPTPCGELAARCGPSWRVSTTERTGRYRSTESHYVFLWNSEKIENEGLATLDSDPDSSFDRRVAFMSFRQRSGTPRYTVCAYTIAPGHNVLETDAEIRRLSGALRRIRNVTQESRLILVGSFGRNRGASCFDALMESAGLGRLSLGLTPTHVERGTTYEQAFAPRARTGWAASERVVRFDDVFLDGDDRTADETVSDCRPIWLTLSDEGG